jgi:hypothetical protein
MLKLKRHLGSIFFLIVSLSFKQSYTQEKKYDEKIIICGVCKDVEKTFRNTVMQIECLGSLFADYAVIIYENNSIDNTINLYRSWAEANPKVTFISECVDTLLLPATRTERIARARNIVLEEARKPKYSDFPFLIMADLDFLTPWPIDEIVRSIHLPMEWDCISSNGVRYDNFNYWDRFAFRNIKYPLGPELLNGWWDDLNRTWFCVTGEEFCPVFSAFGGLAIYKTESILKFRYDGVPTEALTEFYKQIFMSVYEENDHLRKYLTQNNFLTPIEASMNAVHYRINSGDRFQNFCCEHVPLHAAMYVNGYNKFFINPMMCMYYLVD